MKPENPEGTEREPRARLVVAVVGLGVSLAYLAHALLTLSVGALDQPGPAVFPLLVGSLFALTSVGVFVQERRVASGQRKRLDGPRGAAVRRVLGLGVSIAGYAVLVSWLGHLVTGVSMSFLLVRLLGLRPWWRALLIALVIGVSTHVVFVLGLGVALPRGVLW